MSVTTNGQICYGVMFEEGYEFPWDSEEDSDLEEWWRKENGYIPLMECWDDNGRIEGVTDKHVSDFFDHRNEWDKANPIPIVEVNYCCGDYPMMILAVPSTATTANRGYPVEVPELNVIESEKQGLIEFCINHKLDNTDAKWWLSSYWG